MYLKKHLRKIVMAACVGFASMANVQASNKVYPYRISASGVSGFYRTGRPRQFFPRKNRQRKVVPNFWESYNEWKSGNDYGSFPYWKKALVVGLLGSWIDSNRRLGPYFTLSPWAAQYMRSYNNELGPLLICKDYMQVRSAYNKLTKETEAYLKAYDEQSVNRLFFHPSVFKYLVGRHEKFKQILERLHPSSVCASSIYPGSINYCEGCEELFENREVLRMRKETDKMLERLSSVQDQKPMSTMETLRNLFSIVLSLDKNLHFDMNHVGLAFQLFLFNWTGYYDVYWVDEVNKSKGDNVVESLENIKFFPHLENFNDNGVEQGVTFSPVLHLGFGFGFGLKKNLSYRNIDYYKGSGLNALDRFAKYWVPKSVTENKKASFSDDNNDVQQDQDPSTGNTEV